MEILTHLGAFSMGIVIGVLILAVAGHLTRY
jgi:hypothetical protein